VSTEFVAVTVTGGMAVALAIVVTVLIMRKRRFQPLEVVWKQYANERGMRFSFVAGWTRVRMVSGFPPAMAGEVQGVPVEITLDYTRGAEMTRVDATLPGVMNDFLFAIYRRSSESQVNDGLADMVETPTGNKVFDAKFALFSNNSDLSRSILDRRLAQVIGDFRREFTYLHVSRTRFTLMWAGMETDPKALDEAIRVVWTACRRRA
jgi:hypothetical protein